jgi:hypothetical protein
MGDLVYLRNRDRGRGRARRSLLHFRPQITIGEHFEIILGQEITGERVASLTGPRVIEHAGAGFEVSQDGFANFPPNQQFTREGDLLLTLGQSRRLTHAGLLSAILGNQSPSQESDSVPTGDRSRDRLCVRGPIKKVEGATRGCLIGRDVILLRPKDHLACADILLRFFHLANFSSFGPWEWLEKATGATSGSDLVGLLREVCIPVVPDDIADVLEENHVAFDELSHAEPDVMGLLECRNRGEFDRHLLRLRAENYALSQAREASSSRPYLIRNFYPFPIAFPYYVLAAHQGHALLVEQLRVAESLFAFVASLALALSSPASGELPKAFSERRNFSDGIWLEIGRTAIKTLDSADHGDLADGLKLLFGGIFPERADRLVKLRNDYHHNRIDNARISDKTSEISTLLATCFDELAFIVRFPLFRICDGVKVDRLSRRFIHEIEYYGGADLLHEARLMESERSYPSGLYVKTEAGPKDLFPFITIHVCPDCSQPETYFLDRAGKNQGWFVKSFERGHSLEVQDVAEGLSKWRGKDPQR